MPLTFGFNSCWTRDKDQHLEQVADALERILRAIQRIEELAKPHWFKLDNVILIKIERIPSDGTRHSVSVMGEEKVDEISISQIYGGVEDKIINVVVKGIFHTHKNNRSGNGELWLNGKDYYMDKITINDLLQDTGLWKKALEAEKNNVLR